MAKMIQATAIVLAGGKSSRFGSNKALAPWRGATLIESIVTQLKETFSKVLVVAKKTDDYAFLESGSVRIVKDFFKDAHPLSGFQAGLKVSKVKDNFITACDMPFINEKLIRILWRTYQGRDAALCRWKNRIQPFFGFYSRRCLPAIGEGIKNGVSIEEALKSMNVSFVNEEQIHGSDPEGDAFQDIDTEEDYATLSHRFFWT